MASNEPVKSDERALTFRRIVIAVLVVYVVLFILLNTKRISVSFVLFSVRTHLLTALLLIAVLSFFAGYFVGGRGGLGSLFGRRHAEPPPAGQADSKQ
jgi:uncharacterized integral membrane protein